MKTLALTAVRLRNKIANKTKRIFNFKQRIGVAGGRLIKLTAYV